MLGSHSKTVLISILVLLSPSRVVLAEEEDQEKKKSGQDTLEDELEELKEDDYPDLVAVDETGEIMDELAFLAEESVVVSAAKHRQDIAESPSAVTVITREQIQNTHCTDVSCLLMQVPEVNVRELTAFYVSVTARAMDDTLGNKVLVLIDGREINLETMGVPYWQTLVVHLADIERIEVIRGPGSALYGANAHSMVVSIFTRKIERDGVEVVLGSGEHDRTAAHLRAGYRLDDWSFNLSGGYETGGHWRMPNVREREFTRIRLRIDREGRLGTSTLQLGLTTSEGKIESTLGPADSRDGYIGHICLSHQTDWFKAQAYFNAFGTDFHWDMPLVYRGILLGRLPEPLDMATNVLDTDVQVDFEPFEDNLLIAGGNYRWITLMSDVNTPSTVHQHRIGAFLHDEQRLGESLLLTGGVRIDYNNITPFTVSPRLACVWRFTDEQLLRLAFGQAFRKPSFFETSTHIVGTRGEPGFEEIEGLIRDNIGNDELRNESVTSFELGYRGSFMEGLFIVEGDAFFNLYRDTITFVFDIKTNNLGLPSLSESSMGFRNAGREINTVGGSVSVTARPSREWRANVNYTYRHSYYIANPKGRTEKWGKGDRAPWEPAHLFNASLHYLPARGPRMGVAFRMRSATIQAMPENGGIFNDLINIPLPAAAHLSGFLSWRVPLRQEWFEAGIRVFNVLNVGYRDQVVTRQPDGEEVGGELLGRCFYFFLRGSV